MAYKRGNKSKNDGKYLRLTGLWQSKKNDTLWSGKMKPEQVEELKKKVKEALENELGLVFFLWENEKRNKRDADFTVQVAVAEEEVQSRRSNREEEEQEGEQDEQKEEQEEKPKSKKKAAKKDEDW